MVPSILLGWEVPRRTEVPAETLPPWFTAFDHYFGGHTPDEYGSPLAHLVGARLQLEDNLRHGHGDVRELIARLQDGEDRERHFHDKSAEGLSKTRFEGLCAALAACLRVPELERGATTEAFAPFVEGDPLNHFEGWAVHPVASGVVVDDAFSDALRSAGRVLGVQLPVRSFLLWENCDL